MSEQDLLECILQSDEVIEENLQRFITQKFQEFNEDISNKLYTIYLEKTNVDPKGSHLALQNSSNGLVSVDETKNHNTEKLGNNENFCGLEKVEVLQARLSLIQENSKKTFSNLSKEIETKTDEIEKLKASIKNIRNEDEKELKVLRMSVKRLTLENMSLKSQLVESQKELTTLEEKEIQSKQERKQNENTTRRRRRNRERNYGNRNAAPKNDNNDKSNKKKNTNESSSIKKDSSNLNVQQSTHNAVEIKDNIQANISETLNLKFQGPGNEMHFRLLDKRVSMRLIKDNYSRRSGYALGSLVYKYKNKIIEDGDTPESLGMADNDYVQVYWKC